VKSGLIENTPLLIVKASIVNTLKKFFWWYGELNAGLCTCLAGAVVLEPVLFTLVIFEVGSWIAIFLFMLPA
jgi:hypothetical protein